MLVCGFWPVFTCSQSKEFNTRSVFMFYFPRGTNTQLKLVLSSVQRCCVQEWEHFMLWIVNDLHCPAITTYLYLALMPGGKPSGLRANLSPICFSKCLSLFLHLSASLSEPHLAIALYTNPKAHSPCLSSLRGAFKRMKNRYRWVLLAFGLYC